MPSERPRVGLGGLPQNGPRAPGKGRPGFLSKGNRPRLDRLDQLEHCLANATLLSTPAKVAVNPARLGSSMLGVRRLCAAVAFTPRLERTLRYPGDMHLLTKPPPTPPFF